MTGSGPISLVNTVFSNNASGFDGGGASLMTLDGAMEIVNCTILDNLAALDDPFGVGGGAKLTQVDDISSAVVVNTILWGNLSNNNGNDLFGLTDWDGNGTGASMVFFHSLIGVDCDPALAIGNDYFVTHIDQYTAWGYMQDDPQVSPDFHIGPGSPCLDTGDDSVTVLPPADFEGEPRIGGAAVDIGVDEFHGDDSIFFDGFESGDLSAWSVPVS